MLRYAKLMSSPPIMRAYCRCRYGQMHYRVAGPLDASVPPLVLLHQNPASSYEYEPLMAEMSRDRRVIAFDTPGYGMSDPPPAPPGVEAYAASFGDALDDVGITGPVDLYGFHTGTLLCIDLALLRPELVRKVALTGIPMFSPEERAAQLQAALDQPEPDEDGEVVRALVDKFWAYVVRNRDPMVSLDKAVRNFADKARVLHRFTWAYQGVWAYDYARVPLMAKPALLIQPAEELAAVSIQAAAMLPDCTVLELPELKVDIFDVAPSQIADALRAFLD